MKIGDTVESAAESDHEGSFTELAIQMLEGLAESAHTSSVATRKVMIADTFANLEIAKALNRIADALERNNR